MSITKRQEEILKLLEENRFLTVSKLAEYTYTSPSSIRRDLTSLENLHYISRTHGGANIIDEKNLPAAFNLRMTKNTAEKKIIAKKAAALLCDGQNIMLDSSTTAGFLVPYIAKHKNMTVFTNNMITAVNAVNRGISVHCTGGRCINGSASLSGTAAYEFLKGVFVDILFFSSQSLDSSGIISDSTEEENYARRIMLKNSGKKFFLCDSSKFGLKSPYILTSAEETDVCIFDREYSELSLHGGKTIILQ